MRCPSEHEHLGTLFDNTVEPLHILKSLRRSCLKTLDKSSRDPAKCAYEGPIDPAIPLKKMLEMSPGRKTAAGLRGGTLCE